MKLLSHKDIDIEKWDERIRNSSIENIFSYSWYLNTTCNDWGALVTEDYKTIFPFGFQKKLNFRQAYQPIFTRQFEVIGKEFDFQKAIQLLQKESISIQLRNSQFIENSTKRVYQEINLAEGLGFRTNAKRLIKKGNANFEFKPAANPGELIQLFSETTLSKIDTLKKEDLKSLEKLMNKAIEFRKGELELIFENDKMVGGAFFLKDKNRITLLKSTCTDEAKRNGAMYALIGNKITASSKQFLTFDFGGSNEPNVREFYCKFGAKDQTYYEIQQGEKPLWFKVAKNLIGH